MFKKGKTQSVLLLEVIRVEDKWSRFCSGHWIFGRENVSEESVDIYWWILIHLVLKNI